MHTKKRGSRFRAVILAAFVVACQSASVSEALALPTGVEAAASATVAIFDETEGNFGSGVVIGPGLVLTAAHVVQAVDSYGLGQSLKTADGTEYSYLIKSVSDSSDLALLAVQDLATPPVTLSTGAAAGDEVYAIGYPLGLEHASVTKGVVSAPKQEVDGAEYLQTDAAINPGNSGGPLVGADGALVGINVAKVGAGEVDNIGFAVPADQIGSFLANAGVAIGGSVTTTTAQSGASQAAPVAAGSGSDSSGLLVGLLGLVLLAGVGVLLSSRSRSVPGGKVSADVSRPAFASEPVAESNSTGGRQVSLRVEAGGTSFVRSYGLPLVIGRGGGAGLILDDPEVSRAHARIDAAADGSLFIEDLNSSNGLIVEGRKVDRAGMREGREVHLGTSVIVREG